MKMLKELLVEEELPYDIYKLTKIMRWKLKNGDLTGAPTFVNDLSFDCSELELKSLNNAPASVSKSFICSMNPIESLNGCPKIIGGSLDASVTKITDLVGGPKKVLGFYYDVSGCKNLRSLKGAPKELPNGDFNLKGCENLESLEHCPKRIKNILDIARTKISSLTGISDILESVEYITINESCALIQDGGLGLLLVKNLKEINVLKKNTEFYKASVILNKYLEKSNKASLIYDCQKELVDAGLEAYAQL